MSYYIDDDTIERVRSSNNIVDIVSEYLTLKRTGSNYVGICPFHSEKTPSFTVSDTKQFYHCFGCGEGGDVISFIMKKENLSFPEAVKFLADKAGIPLKEKEFKKNKELENKKAKLYEINREAARYFYKNLKANNQALFYLKQRAIDKRTATVFGLGFADRSWDSLYSYLTRKGYKEADIEKAGLIIKKKGKDGYYDRFRNRIIFPIIDKRGRVIAFGGRVIDSSNPKYLNSPETPVFSKGNNLFGLNILRKHSNIKKVVLVEGYMDVISLYSRGIDYTLASLGTAFTEQQAKYLKRYGDEVYLCYDSDVAGLKATDKALEILKKEGINAKVLPLPSGKDPDDFIKEEGKEKFEQLFDSSLSYIDFKIYFYKKQYNLNNLDEKIKFTKNVAKFLKRIKSPIEIDVYLDKISQETNISKEAIKKEIGRGYRNIDNRTISKDKYINTNYRYNKDKIIPVRSVLESGHLIAEKTIINLIFKDEKSFQKIKEHINPEDFMNYECRHLANYIYKSYEDNEELNKERLIEYLDDIVDVDLDKVLEILELDINASDENIDKIIQDLIETLISSKLKFERKKITEQIYNIDIKKEKDERDVEKLKQLCSELVEIDRKLKLHQ
ncbi:DNA primase [Anaerosalibacter bizertensis]|uniref:DNA primase n=1 Tax=Anaerosalibacter bizertensis TaxID=932217 RepID=A0A9Q4AE85_9FIRM|nr:DNA primase [Anaerosalibacter bizertensis]MBV1819710.1 DNA primase [Bacteroidales bacterium MSK.15.36]HHV26248.1 DNA primase [Tissierellia bacterium]MCB5560285.1 DNA primase [Anaerosalibacter bizertensis]MCG4565895.1 DNA primase [Anaerosalibacter bizertensis]MCG4583184.1 DNA primase [Anaerosalibacter bizertensis]